MRITNLEIANFKGIKNAFITFPKDSRVVCLIGAGDSTKSTILQAIEWILWPSWNLPASDSDFFECDTTAPIVLRGTFTELPIKLEIIAPRICYGVSFLFSKSMPTPKEPFTMFKHLYCEI